MVDNRGGAAKLKEAVQAIHMGRLPASMKLGVFLKLSPRVKHILHML